MKIGSLCTGLSGLELGLQYAGIETKPVFVSDIDPAVSGWLDQAMPHTPNLGDFTELDELPEVDIITAGFPCQPVSHAGLRQGINDERWLFDDICRLVSRMDSRPVLFLENVAGILTANGGDAMGRVVYGLADIGYHISWGTLPASAVGAPHRRNRWWGLAYPADTDVSTLRHEQIAVTRGSSAPVARHDPQAATDTSSIRRNPRPRSDTGQSSRVGRHGSRNNDTTTAADTDMPRRQQHSRPEPTQTQLDPAQHSSNSVRFGDFDEAITRWEHVLGRTAPDPTVDGRLNPGFVEWMMGYPEGWVTDIMTQRTKSLKALGNAVVPQCAAEAFLQLSTR